jgi:long-chain acyl-CoA synthetase
MEMIEHNFWRRLDRFGDSLALVDERTDEEWTYNRLHKAALTGCEVLRRPKRKLIFLFGNNDAGTIACYLSALAAGHLIHFGKGAVIWADAEELLDRYEPDLLIWKNAECRAPSGYCCRGELFGYHLAERRSSHKVEPADIALLLSTSGSLGSPKMARLSRKNISAAASQVAIALKLSASDRAITTLPMNFVLGLSVIHGHLRVGASIILTNRSVQDRAFWRLLDERRATSLAGVPWTCMMLRSLSFDPLRHASLRSLSLSGGALDPASLAWLETLANEDIRVFSMYGQTEATGRMCVLPPEHFSARRGSVGKPVDGATVRCDDNGHIVFQGPNVMLGYADRREDLSDRDVLQGELMTGDRGYLDVDGFLYVTGRISRIGKLFGSRINLDEIELFLNGPTAVVATCDDQNLRIYLEGDRSPEFDRKVAALIKRLRVPNQCIIISTVSQLPRNEAGKIRYSAFQTPGNAASLGV